MTKETLKTTIGTASWILRNVGGMTETEANDYCKAILEDPDAEESVITAQAYLDAAKFHIENLWTEPERIAEAGADMGRMQYYAPGTSRPKAAADEEEQSELEKLFNQGAPIEQRFIPATREDSYMANTCSRIIGFSKERRKKAQERLQQAQGAALQAGFKRNQPKTLSAWKKAQQQPDKVLIDTIQAEIRFLKEAESHAISVKQEIHDRSRIRYCVTA